jgi:hypothetical protein
MNDMTLSKELDTFKNDTNIICMQANNLLASLYPSYLVNPEYIQHPSAKEYLLQNT